MCQGPCPQQAVMPRTPWAGRWHLQGHLGPAAWLPSWTRRVWAAWALATRAGTLPWRRWLPEPTGYGWRLPGLGMRAPTAASPRPMSEGLGPGFGKPPVPAPGPSPCTCVRKVRGGGLALDRIWGLQNLSLLFLCLSPSPSAASVSQSHTPLLRLWEHPEFLGCCLDSSPNPHAPFTF